jgi:hypothetical protein
MVVRLVPRLAAALVICVGCTLDLPDRADPPPAASADAGRLPLAAPELVGRYQSNFGFMTLSLAPDVPGGVVGYYGEPVDGRLAGNVIDGRFTFVWEGNRGTGGRGFFERSPDGSITGLWGYGQSDTNGGNWVASRISQ